MFLVKNKVQIFTDGSCIGNPGSGGYCAIIRFRKYEKIISAGYYLTTNNRMELMAVIAALESIRYPCKGIIKTDSVYVYKGITKWIENWKKQNWKKSNKKIIKNYDLWINLVYALNRHSINFKWVKSHSNCKENEYCDKLARLAAINPTIKDKGYKI